MLRTAVIDDEPRSLADLARRLEATGLFEVVIRSTDPLQGLAETRAQAPDLVVLDIEMPGLDGITLAGALPQGIGVVFVSAHSVHALAAFDVAAIDFLLKPVDDARFARMVERVHRRRPIRPEGDDDEGLLVIETRRSKVLCPQAEILAVFAEGDMSRLHLRGDRQLYCPKGLKHFAQVLPPPGYLRLDRSTILNLAAVRETRALPAAKTEVVLADSASPLVMGRAAAARLRQALAEPAPRARTGRSAG